MVRNVYVHGEPDTYIIVDAVKPFESSLLGAMKAATTAGGTVTVRVHVTGEAGYEEKSMDTPSSEKMGANDDIDLSSFAIATANGRPDICSIVREKGNSWHGQAAVAGEALSHPQL